MHPSGDEPFEQPRGGVQAEGTKGPQVTTRKRGGNAGPEEGPPQAASEQLGDRKREGTSHLTQAMQ